MKTVIQIVAHYLKTNKYDGLVSEDRECACDLSDLAPCMEIGLGCQAGYKAKCDCGEGCDWHINAPSGEPGTDRPQYTICEDCNLVKGVQSTCICNLDQTITTEGESNG